MLGKTVDYPLVSPHFRYSKFPRAERRQVHDARCDQQEGDRRIFRLGVFARLPSSFPRFFARASSS